MQGKQDPQRGRFDTVDLDTLVSEDHLLRRIDKKIDFDFIYALTEPLYCAGKGRPSMEPVLFFRMQLLSYLYGMKSDRALCREVHLNVAYRWFCRLNFTDSAPHHSSMSRIRDRFGEASFAEIFEQLIRHWQEQGQLRGQRILADASLMEANAALNSLVERAESDPHARALKNYPRCYHDFREGQRHRKYANPTHVSSTDPEARLVSRHGGYKKLCDKVHFAVDADSRMVTDSFVTSGARHEGPVLPGRVAYLCQTLGLPVKEVIADRGYGRGPTYAQLREQKIRHYIPLHDPYIGRGKLTPRDFSYDRQRDHYRCPQGYYLYPYEKSERGSVKRYRVIGSYCRTCPISHTCLPDNHPHRARFVYRAIHQDEVEAVRRRQNIRAFGKRLTERPWKIEGLFGEAKQNHSMRRARYRGLAKIQIQLYLIAIALNCKRRVEFIFFLGGQRWLNLFQHLSFRRVALAKVHQLACVDLIGIEGVQLQAPFFRETSLAT